MLSSGEERSLDDVSSHTDVYSRLRGRHAIGYTGMAWAAGAREQPVMMCGCSFSPREPAKQEPPTQSLCSLAAAANLRSEFCLTVFARPSVNEELGGHHRRHHRPNTNNTIIMLPTWTVVVLLLLHHLRCCSSAHYFKKCPGTDVYVNCASIPLTHVPIVFNPRLTTLILRNASISQWGQSRPLDVYTRVEELDLSHNALVYIPDESFRNQKVLKILNLSANALTSLTRHQFAGLKSLDWLLMDSNQINETSAETFVPLKKLKYLSLNDNKLTKVPTDVLSEVPLLEELYLAGNLFEEIQMESFPLSYLKILDLSRCPNLQAIRDGALSGAGNLQRLSLSHNSLLRLENHNLFDGLSKLQILDLSFNKMLTYLHPEMFAVVRELRYLNVQSCSLSVIDARISSLMPRLQLLDVRNNSLTCNCSVQWIRSHFLSQRNHSLSPFTDLVAIPGEPTVTAAQPNYEAGAGGEDKSYNVPVSNSFPTALDWLTTPNEYRTEPSLQSTDRRPHPAPSPAPVNYPDEFTETVDVAQLLPLFEEARCTDPVTVRDGRLIDLGPDMTGCFKSDSMTLIVIAALVLGISVGVIIILVVKFRRRIAHCLSFGNKDDKKRKRPYDLSRAFLSSSPITHVSSKFNPTPVSTLHVNNNRKVFHGYDSAGGTMKNSQRSLARMPFDEFGSLSSKPEFIFVHNTINLNRGNNRSGGGGIGDNCGSSAPCDLMDPIYRPRHVINNVRNNPYEVVPIVPPVASHPSSRNWSHQIPRHQQPPDQFPYHLQTQHFTDPDDPFHFYERTYEEAECPLNHHLTPSTEL